MAERPGGTGVEDEDSVGFDFDWIVIGSGFGGTVSALRLSEKGYRVGVLEAGRRFEDDDYARSTWNFRRYVWAPHLGLRGILRFYVFKDVTILAGCGVGGGSLVYANTLYVPPEQFFRAEQWRELQDWEAALSGHYEEAKRMLGATDVPFETDADRLFRELADDLGVADSYARPTVGVYFGEPGETVPDPYFDGEGPDRAGCVRCGACMVGCRFNAKNTLVKNYLYLAERNGVEVIPERTVLDVRPIGAEDGSKGYEVFSVRSGGVVRRRPALLTARGVVFAAGAVGTNLLLRNCKDAGALPNISERLGDVVRTNSEALLAVTARRDNFDFANSVAITSSIYPDEVTHIENVTYGRAGDAMGLLFTMLTEGGTRATRPLKWLRNVVRQPIRALRLLWKRGWSGRTVILLVMQTLHNHLRFRPVKVGRRRLLQTEQDPDNPNPTWIPVANQAAEILAEKMDGTAQSNLPEAVLNTPATAHILGGAVIGESPERGVVDMHQRVFGYDNLLVCDGSVVPANPGVNPSLTITALAEHAMSRIPPVSDEQQREPDVEGVESKEQPEGKPAKHAAGEPAEPVTRAPEAGKEGVEKRREAAKP